MRVRGWIAFVLGLVVCLGAAYAAYMLADYSWNQVVDYRGPYAKQAIRESKPPALPDGEPAPVRTVFVIVDGMREDVSRSMPTIESLRAGGYDAVVKTSQPSLSFPNWTTLMSGAPQRFSGVTTNWFEERVPVETLVDVALAAGRTVAVSAPTDFEILYGVKRAGNVFLRDWTEGAYMSGEIVDHAISLATETSASLVIVHLPDIDEAGHAYGGASQQYKDMALKVDQDLGRLVSALQGPATQFIVAADHGHIDTGGHGGPERVVTDVPAVFAGAGVKLGKGTGTQDQVAPTVAMLAWLAVPRHAAAGPLDVANTAPEATATGSSEASAAIGKVYVALHRGDRFDTQQAVAYESYIRAIDPGPINTADLATGETARRAFDKATDARLAAERNARLPLALALAAVCLVAIVVVGVLSWRALVSALAGVLAFYVVWDGSYFLIHGYRWSLSSFNSEALLKGFLNGRMTDAVIGGVVASLVAAFAYAALHKQDEGARGERLPGWLALGVATVLVVQATLGVQIAWYLWYWGASVSWFIPDLALGFKYDLDLIQTTGLGAAAILAPLVTLLVGRFHPKMRPAKSASSE